MDEGGIQGGGAFDFPNDSNIASSSSPPPPPPHTSALSTTNAASLAKHRQMKGLKRKKRKFTRNIQAPSSTNQKNTNFDYGTFRQFNALLPNQRVDALITPGKKAWSPLSKVKRDWSILKAQLAASASKRRLLAGKSHRDHAKIAKLKVLNNLLMVDLHRERRVSNKMIDEAMVEARCLSDEALEMMSNENEMCITERYGLLLGYAKSALITQDNQRGWDESKRHRLKSFTKSKDHWLMRYNPSST